MKKGIMLLMALFLCVQLSACGCEHEWAEAGCVSPKTCTICEETEGEPLGHTWEDATCAAPRTCTGCGETEGNALPHTWEEATCAAPKTCSVCAATEGDALPHTEGSWESVSVDPMTLEQIEEKRCKVCDALMEEQKTVLTQLHKNKKFLLTCEEIRLRMQGMLDEILGAGSVEVKPVSRNGGYAFTVRVPGSSGRADALVIFSTGRVAIPRSQGDTFKPAVIAMEAKQGNIGTLCASLLPVVLDPSLEDWEAGSDVLLKATRSRKGTLDYNGLRYITSTSEGVTYIVVQFP